MFCRTTKPRNNNMCKYTTIFSIVDDFCKTYADWIQHKLLNSCKQRVRSGKLSLSESVSIMIFYHFSPFKNFKTYYKHFVETGILFKNPPCYERFIQIIPSLFMPIIIMMHYLSGRKTGLYYVDSTHFAVCKNIRINRHKTFESFAARGHSSIDWFYGFKLHMIINDKSEIVALKITEGNIDDRKAFEEMAIKKDLKGKCYADKGYISKELFKRLYQKGLLLITGIKKNMKDYLMPILDKIFLRKRFIIETIFGYLKEQFNIKPSKHRSPTNFFASLFSALIAYQIKPTKPLISYP
jgi:Transposase DDE domain